MSDITKYKIIRSEQHFIRKLVDIIGMDSHFAHHVFLKINWDLYP